MGVVERLSARQYSRRKRFYMEFNPLALVLQVRVRGMRLFRAVTHLGLWLLGISQGGLVLAQDSNQTVQFAQNLFSVIENSKIAEIQVVRLDGNNTNQITVEYATVDGTAVAGTDYQGSRGVVVFGPLETNRTVFIAVYDNTLLDGLRSFRVALSNPTAGVALGTIAEAQVIINDDDGGSSEPPGRGETVQFQTPDFRVSETGQVAVIQVERSKLDADYEFTVQYATSGGMAVAGVDYENASGVLVFPPFCASQSISIPIHDNSATDGARVFYLTLSDPSNGVELGLSRYERIIIEDDEARGIPEARQETAQFQTAEFSVSETGRVAVLQLVRSDHSSPYDIKVGFATVDGSAVAGIDYQATNGVVVLPSFSTNQTILIPIFDNFKADGIRSFQVVLSNLTDGLSLGENTNAEVRIIDDESSTPGSLELTFGPARGFVPGVNALALRANGKILVGGSPGFCVDGSATAQMVQLTEAGALDLFESALPEAATVTAIAEQEDGRVWVAYQLSASESGVARLLEGGAFDPSFAALAADGVVRTILTRPDHTLYLGGTFSNVNGMPHRFLARIVPDGGLDESFQPNLNGAVNCLVPQSDGLVLIGGEFTSVNGQDACYVARLNANGSSDPGFNGGNGNLVRNGTGVKALVVQKDGRVVLGGDFSILYGRGRSALMRLFSNGALDDSFDTSLPTGCAVYSLVLQPDGKVIATGDFNQLWDWQFGVQILRGGVARFLKNGSMDASFNPGSGAAQPLVVAAVLQSDLKLVVAGLFERFNGQSHPGLVRLFGDIATRISNWSYQPGGVMQISVASESGRTYVVECSTNMNAWFPVATNLPDMNGFFYLDTSATNAGVRAYRVIQLNP
jgi:uncharacterized delta-60 repeat protein